MSIPAGHPAPVPVPRDVTDVHDVIVVGGGPAGSTTGAFLARAGRRVLLFERELFPRFHVGESLLPATLPVLERMGALSAIAAHGFQVKYGATFHDGETDFQRTFYFLTNKPWPSYSYQVHRADFDELLLDHAAKQGVVVRQRASVESVALDADGVSVAAQHDGQPITARARFLVDATGRDGLMATKLGRRERIPNLGKVALFAHFRGAERAPGRDEGNIGIYVFDDGWFWWIPLANNLTSLGCVMHARTVRSWAGPLDGLYAEMIRRCPPVARRLASAERETEIHRVANFSYMNEPLVGDRFLAVGDAVAFVDPIFSSGVHIAIQSGELAARAVDEALADGRFTAARFVPYQRAVERGLQPFFRFIHKYYEPAFFEVFLRPKSGWVLEAVLSVLSGGAFMKMGWSTRLALAVLFAAARLNLWARRRAGRPVESRLEW
jgi:flavin-dependent dehydrogenase